MTTDDHNPLRITKREMKTLEVLRVMVDLAKQGKRPLHDTLFQADLALFPYKETDTQWD